VIRFRTLLAGAAIVPLVLVAGCSGSAPAGRGPTAAQLTSDGRRRTMLVDLANDLRRSTWS